MLCVVTQASKATEVEAMDGDRLWLRHGPDQERGRFEVLARRADYHRFVSESLLHEPGYLTIPC